MHLGHEVEIVASTETYLSSGRLGYIKHSSYINENGIPVTRIPYAGWLPKKISSKLRIYKGLAAILHRFKPEIIFLHDVQFLSVYTLRKYVKSNQVVLIADSHTDFINSAKTWVSREILHKVIYRHCVKIIDPYIVKYFGTLPVRSKFLHDVYKIPKDKIDLLVFGADDSDYTIEDEPGIRLRRRKELNIDETDFVVITGGKIDRRKNIHILLRALQNNPIPNVKVILFGKITDEVSNEIKESIKNMPNLVYLSWLDSKSIYEVLMAADLAFFPGTHSVLWEQAVGVGLPCVFKKWELIDHVDVGGNCIFIEDATESSIINTLSKLIADKELYNMLKSKAKRLGPQKFTYSKIAAYSLQV